MRKIIFAIAALMICVLVLGPYAFGVWFQKNYQQFISSVNSSDIVQASIQEYQRGWMSSDVMLKLAVSKTCLDNIVEDENALKKIPVIYIKQHIQHGPLFYKYFMHAKKIIGLSAVENTITMTPDIHEFLLLFGIKNLNIQSDIVMSFTNRYLMYLTISGLNVDGILNVPHIRVELNQYLDKHRVWLGSGSLFIPEITLKETDENDIRVVDLSVEGFTKADNDYLNAGRKIKIKSIQFENQLIGPIYFNMSAHKIYLPAIHNVFAELYDFIQRGEVYQGQLKQKLASTIPKLVIGGSSINVDELHIAAPHGDIKASGSFDWPEEGFLPPSGMREIILSGHGKGEVKISKNLMKDVIYLTSTIPDFIRDVAEPQRPLLIETQKRMEFAMRQNLLFIDHLSSRGYISRQAEDTLVAAQKDFIPMEEYTKIVRDLFLDRQISLVVSYQLGGQYSQIMKSYTFLKGSVDRFQKIAEKQIADIFKGWIKKGYVNETKNDYTATLHWTEKSFISNGLEVK